MKPTFFRPVAAILAISLLLAVIFIPFSTARADVAPPEQPPGTNIFPGNENTQVRMLAETVTLTVLPVPAAASIGQAATRADFTMRNLGSAEERMEVRFPLTFWNGSNDGFFNYPAITDFRVSVNGRSASHHF